MAKTRNNHYVPQWYQKGFTSEQEDKLCCLTIKNISLPDGTNRDIESVKWYTPAQCFYKKDLYSTFLRSAVNDEIERKLFGEIDGNGSLSIRAFLTNDIGEWHSHFKDLFIYLDAQKLRTPKGLDWIKAHYPELSQNELMLEMQSIRNLHCVLWAEGIRELVSAEDSDVKFIMSDHPVTVYNYACPPDSKKCEYPNDPDIALKGTQTIFPLDKNRCLILTNQEYAQNPNTTNPLELRTNAKKIRNSMVDTYKFINSRKLTSHEVTQINYIIKQRCKNSIGSGSKKWLYPEKDINLSWDELRHTLSPPCREFKSEILARFDDGSVHYQDAYGRKKKHFITGFLEKDIDEKKLSRNDQCGCGSGKKYKKCCQNIPDEKRTSWSELSVRERNLALCNCIRDVLGISAGKSWDDVRKEISEQQISEIYQFFELLWPEDTDIYSLLPKPDGKFRALYTGQIDVRTIIINALGIAPHYDEFLIEHPFVYAKNMNPEISPVENPKGYIYMALKDFLFMMVLEPYIASGLVNLFPDISIFDDNLRKDFLEMANMRDKHVFSQKERKLITSMQIEDTLKISYSMPKTLRDNLILHVLPNLSSGELEEYCTYLDDIAEKDPLIPLTNLTTNSSQYVGFMMLPNYELSLFIAQVTGAVIVTDSESRWMEFQLAQHHSKDLVYYPWKILQESLRMIPLDYQASDTLEKSQNKIYFKFRKLLKSINQIVSIDNQKKEAIEKLKVEAIECENEIMSNINEDFRTRVEFLAPKGGFYDKNVQRLLLKSSSQHYLDNVSSVYYIHS